MQKRYYGRGYTILNQGAPVDHVHFINSGWIQLFHMTASGKSVVDFLGPGVILGLMEVMTATRFAVTVRTLEDCEVGLVEAGTFLDFVEKNPASAMELLGAVSSYFQRVLHHLYDVTGKVSSERRLLRALYEMGEHCALDSDNGRKIRLPLTVQDLADRIGCSRQWTSVLLANLESKGIIERRAGWLVLTPEGLKFRGNEPAPKRRKRSRRI